MKKIKLILIDHTQVGKTAIIIKFTEGTFQEEYIAIFAKIKE